MTAYRRQAQREALRALGHQIRPLLDHTPIAVVAQQLGIPRSRVYRALAALEKPDPLVM